MATRYSIFKSFQDWKGLHKGFTDYIRPAGYSDTATNCDLDDNGDVVKRNGHQFFTGQAFTLGGTFVGIFTYVYFDSTTEARKEELLLVTESGTLHRLSATDNTITITRTAPLANCVLNFYLTSAGVWQVEITEAGTPVTGYPKTYGDGLGRWQSGSQSLAQLVSDIDALANYTCTATSTNEFCELHPSTLPITFNLNVGTGSGVTISFPNWDTINIGGAGLVPSDNTPFHPDMVFVPEFVNLTGVNLNNAFYLTTTGNYLYKYDGQRYYRAGVPTPFQPFGLTTSAGALTGTYKYHLTYVMIDKRGNRFESAASSEVSVSPSAQQVTLNIGEVATSDALGLSLATAASAFVRVSKRTFNDKLGILGRSGGAGTGDTIAFTDSGGTFRNEEVISIDYSAVDYVQYNIPNVRTVAVDVPIYPYTLRSKIYTGSSFQNAPAREFLSKGALVNGAQAGVTTITVFSGHTLVVGDAIYFRDSTTLEFYVRNVTAIAATTITIDGAAVSVAANSVITINVRAAIWRTKANGTEKYLVAEIPIPTEHGATTFRSSIAYTDNKADDQLLVKYVYPVRAPDPPPKCKYAVVHQGLLILAGDPVSPNTVYFSEPGKPEYFPAATNSFIVPFSTSGHVTGLGVDNGILVVFKDDARAYVYGNLAANEFTIEVKEDGIGCPGHKSIAGTPAGLTWFSNIGFQRSYNGQLDPEFWSRTAFDFANQVHLQNPSGNADSTKFVAKRAIGFHDYINKKYICTVPKESGVLNGFSGSNNQVGPTTGTVVFVYDYEGDFVSYASSNTWSVLQSNPSADVGGFSQILNGYGGYNIYKGELYFIHTGKMNGTVPAVGRLSHVVKMLIRDDQYGMMDQGLGIPFEITTNWESLGEPSVFKKVLRQKTYVANPDLLDTTSTLTVQAHKDYDASTPYSQYTQAFATTTRNKENRLVGQKVQSIRLKFANSNLLERARISGYEYEVAPVSGPKIKE